MYAALIPTDGSDPVVLRRDVTLVGRKRDLCDLHIEKSSVSKLHCLIVKTDGLLFIRDLGSTNGTRVNGQKVVRGALLPGDELSFAGATFRVEMGPARDDEADEDVNIHESVTETLPVRSEPPQFAEFQVDRDSDSDVRLLESSDDVPLADDED